MARSLIALLLTLLTLPAAAQTNLTQRVRGTILDAESKRPIADVVVTIPTAAPLQAVTDSGGRFLFPAVPVGRQTFVYAAPGYEAGGADVVIISGKETELSAALKESVSTLGEVTVRTGRAGKPLNEFATLSARWLQRAPSSPKGRAATPPPPPTPLAP